jgi:hypothetical protein
VQTAACVQKLACWLRPPSVVAQARPATSPRSPYFLDSPAAPQGLPTNNGGVASPCLTGLVVSPCGARAEFSVGHYIVVSSPPGGAGGRVSESFRTLRT